jgi:POT family proton-dependent oligopeptide transporter
MNTENYMQNALGLGQSQATTIFNAYYMYSFLTPIPFAIVSDSWLGRYTVLCISLRHVSRKAV